MRITTLNRLEWLTTEQRLAVQRVLRYGLPKVPKEQRTPYGNPYDLTQWPKTEQWYNRCYNPPSCRELTLSILNEICQTHGVESISSPDAYKHKSWNEHRYSGDIIAEYLNTGESYTPTIVYRYDLVRPWCTISMGDLIELYERKGIRVE